MMEGFGEIMTLEETAKYLKIGKSTLYKMAREGKIPAVKIANQWRFRKDEIDEGFKRFETAISTLQSCSDSSFWGCTKRYSFKQ